LDPDSVTLWIRIRIGNPDPGGKKIHNPDFKEFEQSQSRVNFKKKKLAKIGIIVHQKISFRKISNKLLPNLQNERYQHIFQKKAGTCFRPSLPAMCRSFPLSST
jgi:hypothetical protein